MENEKQRERLVELLNEATFGVNVHTLADHLSRETIERVADYLMSNNVVVLPCKVGDKVYLDNLHIKYADVIGIYIDAFGGVFDLRIYTNIQLANGFGYKYFISKDYTFEDIGKRIFLTKEAAEQALKEREENAK